MTRSFAPLLRPILAILLLMPLVVSPACGTARAQGASAGLGIGALIGGLAGDREGALIGAGVGAGIGYLIGDAEDRRRAGELSKVPAQDLVPLAGTRWRLARLETDEPHDIGDLAVSFGTDGRARAVKTAEDGSQETTFERYRIVGDTLIVNRDDYVLNLPFALEKGRLYVDSPDGTWSAILDPVN